jgi:D-tyrosyl-tRNA(Tyr) deacylase
MRCVIQVCDEASLLVEQKQIASIRSGMVVFVGFTHHDQPSIIDRMLMKLIQLRIFPDASGKTNLSLADVKGQLLLIPNFTLYADANHQRRPSFTEAAKPEQAKAWFDYMQARTAILHPDSQFGIFGADMSVIVHNRGPFTLTLDSDTYERKT